MTSDGQFSKPRRFWNINMHEHRLEKISTFKQAYLYGKIDAKTDEQQCQFINLEYHLNLCCVKIINLSDDLDAS